MLGQHSLDPCVVKELVLRQPKDLKGLIFGNEAPFNPEALFCDLLAADVLVPLRLMLRVLLVQVLSHFLQSLGLGNRADVARATATTLAVQTLFNGHGLVPRALIT